MSKKSRERRERHNARGQIATLSEISLYDTVASQKRWEWIRRADVIEAQEIYEIVAGIFNERPLYYCRQSWNIYRDNRYSDDYGVREDEELEETISDWCISEAAYWRSIIGGLKLPHEKVFIEFHVTDERDALHGCRVGVLLTENHEYRTLSAKTFILAKQGNNIKIKEDRDCEWTMSINDGEIDGEFFHLSALEDSQLEFFDYRMLVPLMALTCLNVHNFTLTPINSQTDYKSIPPLDEKRSERAKMTPSLRFEILERDGFQCRSCGRNPREHQIKLHVDHIVPIARGGETEPYNLHTLCEDCNLGKRDKRVAQMETW